VVRRRLRRADARNCIHPTDTTPPNFGDERFPGHSPVKPVGKRLVLGRLTGRREVRGVNDKLLPLGVLYTADEQTLEGITRFQKLAFLAQRERDGAAPYDFRADNYGPFAPELYDDIDRLVDAGFVDYHEGETQMGNTKQVYELTDKGKRAVENSDPEEFPVETTELESLNEDFSDDSLWDVLEYVYTEYPRMARNSELSLV
jgi:uncharacterized protein YwgA